VSYIHVIFHKYLQLETLLCFAGFSEEFAEGMKDYKRKYVVDGNVLAITESFSGEKYMVNRVPLDKETEYEILPGTHRKVLITATGPYTYKWISKNREGTTNEDMDLTFTNDGLHYVRGF